MINTWPCESIEILVRDYPHTSTAELAKALCKPCSSVVWKANYLGLKKTPEHLQQIRAEAGSKNGWRNAQNMVLPPRTPRYQNRR